jgi:uncharacterized RmlC-like cupin family protein
MKQAEFFDFSSLIKAQVGSGKPYMEFLRDPAMSAGIYALGAGGTDRQTPHKEGEMYYVVRGKARMKAGSQDQAVHAGSVIFVAGGVEHRFYDIVEDVTILVFFAPAESS